MPTNIGVRADGSMRFTRAAVGRRVACAALDYVVLAIVIIAVSVAAPFTVYLLDFIVMPLVAIYWAARDLRGGAYDPGKLLGGFRVLDARSGEIATAKQALIRNSYYVVLIVMSGIPVFEWANTGLVLLVMLVDVLIMLATPDARRLGDMLAGTQVVPVRKPLV